MGGEYSHLNVTPAPRIPLGFLFLDLFRFAGITFYLKKLSPTQDKNQHNEIVQLFAFTSGSEKV